MSLVATLIANPAIQGLSSTIAHSASAALGASPPDWLEDGIACDIEIPHQITKAEAESVLRNELAENPVDFVIQKAARRRKQILLADMDSTMIGQECIDELADAVGLKSKVAAITARAMNGEIEFEPALRERVALLKGLPLSAIEEVIRSRITLAPGACELVRTMKKYGGRTILVSGGFTLFTSVISRQIGFDEHYANELLISRGALTGKVREPVLGRAAKAEAVGRAAKASNVKTEDVCAVGDGANDLDMLNLAGTGVALHAKPAVAAAARYRIDFADLTALLYIQGYRGGNIVR